MVDCCLSSADDGLDFIKITMHPPSSSDSRALPPVQSKRNLISLPIGRWTERYRFAEKNRLDYSHGRQLQVTKGHRYGR
jgi:hypothetical protein